jgi:hypothetical protein
VSDDLIPYDVSRWGKITPHEDTPPVAGPMVLGAERPFHYIGAALTLDEFDTTLALYQWGPVKPSWLVLHHTAVPTVAQWTDGEARLTEAQIKVKRLRQLAGIAAYYRDRNGWDRGPHLFIDARYVYLFTPMTMPGIHATTGNGTAQSFSLGIEVIGDYTRVVWSENTRRMVVGAVARLHRHLGTFDIRESRGPGGIARHADYNKPECPGKLITPAYYLPLFREAVAVPPAVRAGVYGAIARTDYQAEGAAAAYFPPGTVIPLTDGFYKNGFYHAKSGIGFVARGDVERI